MDGSVLIVEDNDLMAGLIAEVLQDEGFTVTRVTSVRAEVIHEAVSRLEPDVVLLDGATGSAYGESWTIAAWLHERSAPIPVVMFTAHADDLAEAVRGASERSRRAAFAGVLGKPFNLQTLVDVLSCAVATSASGDSRVAAAVEL